MSELGRDWQLFPLYGLTVTDDDDGLREPIFGAATLVSTEWAGKMATDAHGTKEIARMLSGATLVTDLGADRLERLAADPKHVVECQPHSYIAVRNRNRNDAEHHAARVRAMLSGAVVLRGRLLKAFSPSPLSLAWSTVPVKVREHQGKLQGTTRIALNEHTFLRPEIASKAELRASWKEGRPIPLSTGATWDTSSAHAFTKILCGQSGVTTELKQRLQAGAIQLNEASNVPFPMSQLQMAVAALEITLGTNTFPKLESLMGLFLPVAEDRVHLRRVLQARNFFVHEGVVVEPKEQRFLVGKALLFGWVFLALACDIAERRKGVGGFDDELEARLVSLSLSKILKKLGKSEDAQALLASISTTLSIDPGTWGQPEPPDSDD